MTWLSVGARLELKLLLAGLLIININLALDTGGEEVITIVLVVASEQLRILVVDFVKLLVACGVPVVQTTIGICVNDNVLGYSGGVQRSPSKLGRLALAQTYLITVVGIGSAMFSLRV